MTLTVSPITALPTRRWKSYPVYKDFGVGWLREVPDQWILKRLKFAVSQSDARFDRKPDGITYVGLEHVEARTGRLLLDVPIETVESAVSSFKEGDILFGKLRPYLAKVAYASFNGVCTTELLVLRPIKSVDVGFLHYQLLSDGFIKLVTSMTYGAKMPRINEEQLGNITIPLPTLDEQRTIAAFLDRQTASIDALVAKKEHQIKLLQEERVVLINKAVTQGFDSTAPAKNSGVEWLGQIPAHWKVQRLKFAAQLESGHTPSRTVDEYWDNCTIPWVTLNDVGYLKTHDYIFDTINYINELGLAHSSAQILPAGTVILSRDATVGRCGILERPMATSQHFVNWICHAELLPEYLLLVFKVPMQQEFERLTIGSTIRTIGMPDVNSFRVPIPPIAEQKAIVSYVNCETARIDALMAKVREHIDRLREYRTALISAAVTGKIDVRES